MIIYLKREFRGKNYSMSSILLKYWINRCTEKPKESGKTRNDVIQFSRSYYRSQMKVSTKSDIVPNENIECKFSIHSHFADEKNIFTMLVFWSTNVRTMFNLVKICHIWNLVHKSMWRRFFSTTEQMTIQYPDSAFK